jgi:hypothetical protein
LPSRRRVMSPAPETASLYAVDRGKFLNRHYDIPFDTYLSDLAFCSDVMVDAPTAADCDSLIYRCLGFMGIASPVPIYTCHVPLGLASRVFSSIHPCCHFRAPCQGLPVFARDPRLTTQSERDLGPSSITFSLSRGRTLLQVTPGTRTGRRSHWRTSSSLLS